MIDHFQKSNALVSGFKVGRIQDSGGLPVPLGRKGRGRLGVN